MSKIDAYKDAQNKVAEARKQAQDVAKEAFAEGAKAVFDAHPRLLAFRWTQYTPHFNDGEPCEFSVHECYVKLDTTPANGGDYGDGFEYPCKDKVAGKIRNAANQFVDSFDSDDMADMFGDGYRITATREGEVKVDEYDHD